MEAILEHFKTALEAITFNSGTVDDPVIERRLKVAQIDNGQLDEKVTLQLPAAYFDITEMAYSNAGENIGLADTEITVRLAVRKSDLTRYLIIDEISKALAGTHGTSFGGILKESQRKVSYDDIFEYRITFGCIYYDLSAVPQTETLTGDDRPALNMDFRIK